MPPASADVVVIGGGVNGASVAMHLARMGAGRVVLVERGHLASGASGRSGAMVREHYLHPTLVEMAMEASDVFHNFGDVVGGDARFIQSGRVLIFPEMHRAAVEANFAMNRELGVNIRLLPPDEVSRLVPMMNTEDISIGLYEPDSGYADPVATTYAYADSARRSGAQILTETPVSSISVEGGRVRGVRAAHGLIETDAVVSVIGPWSNTLAAPIGEALPITPIRVQMVHLRRPPTLESLTVNVIDYTTGAYFRVDSGFGTLIGGEAWDDLTEIATPTPSP